MWVDDIGLLKGPDGENRTIYSFRHTYATERLTQGVTYEDLALNMGTSYEQIRKHYSHVVPQQRADAITKQEGFSAAQIVKATSWLQKAVQGNDLNWDELIRHALAAQEATANDGAGGKSLDAA